MSRRRLLFKLLFFTGTVLAALGWYAEWKLMLYDMNTFIVVGHALQVIGLFGYMMTPDAIVRIKEHPENYKTDEYRDKNYGPDYYD
jgi:hypothetical protein